MKIDLKDLFGKPVLNKNSKQDNSSYKKRTLKKIGATSQEIWNTAKVEIPNTKSYNKKIILKESKRLSMSCYGIKLKDMIDYE